VQLGFSRRAIGHSIQPTAHRLALADGSRLANQHEKRGLKGVFDGLFIREDAAAHPEDHRAKALDQGFKGDLIPIEGETLQQLGIRRILGAVPAEEVPEVLQPRPNRSACHPLSSPGSVPLLNSPRKAANSFNFFLALLEVESENKQ